MLRVASNFTLTLADGRALTCAQVVKTLLKGKRPWEVRSAGRGSKGRRWYAWAWAGTGSGEHSLLVRRHLKTGELAFHYCFVPAGQQAPKARLVRAAGLRWPVEVGHRWYRSSCAAFSWLCSLFLVGLVFFGRPAGAGVVAGRAGPALA